MNYGVQINEYKGKTIGYYGSKFLPFHKGHLNCILQSASMVDVLFVVVGYDDEWDKLLCEGTEFDWVSSRVRERLVTKALKNIPNIRVLSHYERRSEDYMNDPMVKEANDELLEKLGGKIDYVFSSELEYEEYFNKYLPNSKHIILDSERSVIDISATKIREDGVHKHWDMLPRSVQEHYTKRIAFCGIESTGKSFMTKNLAALFNTNFVEEYGRTYYDEINGCFDIDAVEDFYEIAAGHTHLINQAVKDSNEVMFIDTDLIYTQFFRVNGYGTMCPVVASMIWEGVEKIDLYIYLEPHNEHELDGSRLPIDDEKRNKKNDFLKRLYRSYGVELVIVDEKDKAKRLEKCIDLVKNYLN